MGEPDFFSFTGGAPLANGRLFRSGFLVYAQGMDDGVFLKQVGLSRIKNLSLAAPSVEGYGAKYCYFFEPDNANDYKQDVLKAVVLAGEELKVYNYDLKKKTSNNVLIGDTGSSDMLKQKGKKVCCYADTPGGMANWVSSDGIGVNINHYTGEATVYNGASCDYFTISDGATYSSLAAVFSDAKSQSDNVISLTNSQYGTYDGIDISYEVKVNGRSGFTVQYSGFSIYNAVDGEGNILVDVGEMSVGIKISYRHHWYEGEEHFFEDFSDVSVGSADFDDSAFSFTWGFGDNCEIRSVTLVVGGNEGISTGPYYLSGYIVDDQTITISWESVQYRFGSRISWAKPFVKEDSEDLGDSVFPYIGKGYECNLETESFSVFRPDISGISPTRSFDGGLIINRGSDVSLENFTFSNFEITYGFFKLKMTNAEFTYDWFPATLLSADAIKVYIAGYDLSTFIGEISVERLLDYGVWSTSNNRWISSVFFAGETPYFFEYDAGKLHNLSTGNNYTVCSPESSLYFYTDHQAIITEKNGDIHLFINNKHYNYNAGSGMFAAYIYYSNERYFVCSGNNIAVFPEATEPESTEPTVLTYESEDFMMVFVGVYYDTKKCYAFGVPFNMTTGETGNVLVVEVDVENGLFASEKELKGTDENLFLVHSTLNQTYYS